MDEIEIVFFFISDYMNNSESYTQSTMSDMFSDFSDSKSDTTSFSQESYYEDSNPYALDPSFSSKEEMSDYLREMGQVDVIVTRDELEVEIENGVNSREISRLCDCGHCVLLSDTDGIQYLCCNQRFPSWKADLCKKDEAVSCVTQCQVHIAI